MGCILELILHLADALSGGISRRATKGGAPRPYRLRTRGRPWYLVVWLAASWALSIWWRGPDGNAPTVIHPATVLGRLVLLTVLFPWPLARSVTIPLGLVRTSYYLALAASFTWWRDPAGGALTAAVLARMRHRRARPRIDGWLRTRFENLRALRAGAAVAAALKSDLDGDDDLAREKMRAVADFDSRVRPRAAYRLAAEWLLLDAARRGDWREARDAFQGRWRDALRWSRIARLLDAVARRLLREPDTPGDGRLRWLHLRAPRRRLMRPLVQRALATGRGDEMKPATRHLDALERALRLHVDWMKGPAARLDSHGFEILAHAWQEALGTVRPGSEASKAAFRESVEESLAVLIEAAPVDLSDATPTRLVADALESVLDFRVRELSDAVEELAVRMERSGTRSPSHELGEWCGLRRLYLGIARLPGPSHRQTAYSMVSAVVHAQAIRMFKVFQERPLANAMFRWLLAEAEATGHEDAGTLEEHVSLGV